MITDGSLATKEAQECNAGGKMRKVNLVVLGAPHELSEHNRERLMRAG